MTALDISTEALEVARERAPDVAYIHADVHDLPLEVRRARFDLVYTGGGVLVWLHDLDAWAGGIATALKPGGTAAPLRRASREQVRRPARALA